MGREIKFRCFFYDGNDYSTGKIISAKEAFAENYIDLENEALQPTDNCTIIMQYIGIIDRNKKEIYEADIVQDIYSNKWVVKCSSNYVAFYFSGVVELTLYGMGNKSIEVIGNIYEQPELIKP